jgi:hypothetical protein
MSNFLLGGRMGDLIHQLWVIKNTPGKHDLWVTDNRASHSDGFMLPLFETCNELLPILKEQEWLKSLNSLVFDGMGFDENQTGQWVNLNMWRRYVYSASWTPLLARTFEREPNGEPWITLPKISGWEDRIVFHCSVHAARRGHWNIAIDKYNDERAIFVGTWEEYKTFGYGMEYYGPQNLKEHFDIINSCKFFVGNQSMPLAAAHAVGVPRLAILNKVDEIAYRGEEQWHKNFYWISDSDFFFEGINY